MIGLVIIWNPWANALCVHDWVCMYLIDAVVPYYFIFELQPRLVDIIITWPVVYCYVLIPI